MIAVQSWGQYLWTIYECKKENISQSDNAYKAHLFSSKNSYYGNSWTDL